MHHPVQGEGDRDQGEHDQGADQQGSVAEGLALVQGHELVHSVGPIDQGGAEQPAAQAMNTTMSTTTRGARLTRKSV